MTPTIDLPSLIAALGLPEGAAVKQRIPKKMLLETLGATRSMVSACGIAGMDLERITSRRLGACTVFGDFATDCAAAPLYAHKVVTVANHMSAHLLRLLEASHDNTTG